MKSLWNGMISFGLVNIPIKLYSAIEQKSIGFMLVCKKCKTPIHYKRYCSGCKKEVEWEDVLKGLELEDEEYITFTQEELNSIKPEKTNHIEIIEFVDQEQIPPIYINKPYFCAPAKAKEKAYFLLKRVLEENNKVAIGRFVMREKEYTCSIQNFQEGLLLSTLNYNYEIRDIAKIEELKEKPKLKKEEVDLAKQLIDQLYQKEFDNSRFKDTFAERLKKTIQRKEKIFVMKPPEEEEEYKEETLMKTLKASLGK